MYTFDTSAIIHAWDNYPIDIFPPLWEWMAERINTSYFTIPQCAYDECGHNSPDCQQWLDTCNLLRHGSNEDIFLRAASIKSALNINGDEYNKKGVDENDLIIISTAKELSLKLVSNEALQAVPPPTGAKYKIPAVCNLPCAQVPCISFVNLLKHEKPDLRKYALGSALLHHLFNGTDDYEDEEDEDDDERIARAVELD